MSLRAGLVVATLVLLVVWILSDVVWAQVPLPPPIVPSPTPLPKELPKPEPPVPSILPPAPVPERRGPIPQLKVFVREIRVQGSTVFKPEELAQVTDPYRDREITSEDIESLRLAMTMLYVRHGYSTSGTLVPDQAIVDGVLTIQVIEGKLSRIDVEGNYWFRSSYFTSRLRLNAGPPVNVHALQERLQLFQTDPRIERINAELRPGETRGESALHVRVAERRPIKAWLEYNNFQAPAVGSNQVLGTIADQNLLGFGDALSVQYGQSFGTDSNAHGSGINPNFNARYVVPFTPYDTTFAVDYRKVDFTVIESTVKPLDINGKFESIGFTLRQPVFRTPSQEFALALTGQSETFKTSLLGSPFEFQSGSTNGVSRGVGAALLAGVRASHAGPGHLGAVSDEFRSPHSGGDRQQRARPGHRRIFFLAGPDAIGQAVEPHEHHPAGASRSAAGEQAPVHHRTDGGGRALQRKRLSGVHGAWGQRLSGIPRGPYSGVYVGDRGRTCVPGAIFRLRPGLEHQCRHPFSGVVSECGSRSDLEFLAREPLRGVLGPASESPGQSPYQSAGFGCASAVGGRGVLAGC